MKKYMMHVGKGLDGDMYRALRAVTVRAYHSGNSDVY